MGSITLEYTQNVVILVAYFCLYDQYYVQAISQIASKIIDCLPIYVKLCNLESRILSYGNTPKAVQMSLEERCGDGFLLLNKV